MKKYLYTLALTTSLFTPLAAQAIEGLSANAAVSSNYLWRGVTQTLDEVAVSGGIDYAHQSGFYVGTWASNVDFGSFDAGVNAPYSDQDASYELDFYAGYSGSAGDLAYDLGYIYYAYPDDEFNDIDLGEIYASLSYSHFTFGAAYLVNSGDDAFSEGMEDDWLYLNLDAGFELSDGLELAFHLGSFSGDSIEDWLADDYIDYNISLSKSGFTFMVADTNLDGDDLKVVVSYSVEIDL
jgi:uncharacterized protein (TIGR02001 family)